MATPCAAASSQLLSGGCATDGSCDAAAETVAVATGGEGVRSKLAGMGAFRSLRNSNGPTLSPSSSTQSPCSSERRSAKENPAREERDTESKSCSTSQASTARSASWRDRLAAAAATDGEGCGEADRDEVEEVAPLVGREEPMDADVAGAATAAAAEIAAAAADTVAAVGAETMDCCTGTATAMRPADGANAGGGEGAEAKGEGEGALLGRSVGEGFAEEDADAVAVVS